VVGVRQLAVRVRDRVNRLRSPEPVRDERVPRLRQRVNTLADQVQTLSSRVEELEAELLDARAQGRRIGEISDVITELLANEASRRDPEFQRIVDKFASEHRS
jgi:uncharacterized protein YlxW (UPF0749 family)